MKRVCQEIQKEGYRQKEAWRINSTQNIINQMQDYERRGNKVNQRKQTRIKRCFTLPEYRVNESGETQEHKLVQYQIY